MNEFLIWFSSESQIISWTPNYENILTAFLLDSVFTYLISHNAYDP